MSSLFPSSPGAQSVAACAIVMLAVSGFALVLRLITRGCIVHTLGNEDWVISTAFVFSIGNTVGMVLQAEYALGQHIWDVSMPHLEQFLKAAYSTIISYNISLTLTKTSILLLYLRIFQGRIRKFIYVVMVLVIMYGIWVVLSAIFYCTPISAFWDITLTDAVCFAKEAKWFTDAGLNIATDFAIFLLPLPAIGSLNLPRKPKIILYCVFTVGFFVCIFSILRLHSLHVAAVSEDPTWDHVGVAIWSTIELNVAIVCACLTTLKPLLSRVFPRLLATTKDPPGVYVRQRSGPDVPPRTTVSSSTMTSCAPDGVNNGNESERGIMVGSTASVELRNIDV